MYYDGANFNAIIGKTDPVGWDSMQSTTTSTRPSANPTGRGTWKRANRGEESSFGVPAHANRIP